MLDLTSQYCFSNKPVCVAHIKPSQELCRDIWASPGVLKTGPDFPASSAPLQATCCPYWVTGLRAWNLPEDWRRGVEGDHCQDFLKSILKTTCLLPRWIKVHCFVRGYFCHSFTVSLSVNSPGTERMLLISISNSWLKSFSSHSSIQFKVGRETTRLRMALAA